MIAPSVLSADFLNLGRDVEMINASEAALFHVDVMDGCFVPNISFGLPVIKAIKRVAKKPLDVHLMIVQPERYFEDFKNAGADLLSVHIEASTHLHRSLQSIKALGMKAGVAINPHTPVSQLSEVLMDTDIVCMMSVNPGFGGQSFIPNTLNKIRELKKMIVEKAASTLIEIDGGVTLENAAEIYAAGADILVAGNTVFSAADPSKMISDLNRLSK